MRECDGGRCGCWAYAAERPGFSIVEVLFIHILCSKRKILAVPHISSAPRRERHLFGSQPIWRRKGTTDNTMARRTSLTDEEKFRIQKKLKRDRQKKSPSHKRGNTTKIGYTPGGKRNNERAARHLDVLSRPLYYPWFRDMVTHGGILSYERTY